MRRRLADWYRPGEEAPPNLSLLSGRLEDGVRQKHVFYRGTNRRFLTSSNDRLLRAVFRALAEYDLPPIAPGVVRLAVTSVIRGDDVVLIDSLASWLLDDIAPKLARRGFRIVDTGVVDVRLADMSADLRVPEDWSRNLADVPIVEPTADDRFAATEVPSTASVARLMLHPVRIRETADGEVSTMVSLMPLVKGDVPDDDTLAAMSTAFTSDLVVPLVQDREERLALFEID